MNARPVFTDTNMKTKTQPPVLKSSSKPAGHNAARVRNNQRRHRARAREHVQDLERRLGETAARLEAALQTISHLAHEVEALRGRVPAPPPPAAAWPRLLLPDDVQPADSPMRGRHDSPDKLAAVEEELVALEPTVAAAAAPSSSATEEEEETGGDGDSAEQDCGCSDSGLPPQAPGESTLPCASAFRIIEQQQSLGGRVEVTAARAWLGPGFRRALRPGGECRVETGRVYELLDRVMSDS